MDRRPHWKFFCPKSPCGHFRGPQKSLTCTSALISRTILLLIPPFLSPVLNDIE